MACSSTEVSNEQVVSSCGSGLTPRGLMVPNATVQASHLAVGAQLKGTQGQTEPLLPHVQGAGPGGSRQAMEATRAVLVANPKPILPSSTFLNSHPFCRAGARQQWSSQVVPEHGRVEF